MRFNEWIDRELNNIDNWSIINTKYSPFAKGCSLKIGSLEMISGFYKESDITTTLENHMIDLIPIFIKEINGYHEDTINIEYQKYLSINRDNKIDIITIRN